MVCKIYYALCLVVISSQVAAFPFVNLMELPRTPEEVVRMATDLWRSDQVLSAEYSYEGIPGKDFLDYHRALGTTPQGISDERYLDINHRSSANTLVWGSDAFDLVNIGKVNGITMKRQRLLSGGLIIDYFPDTPSASIRPPDNNSMQLTLYDFLNKIPKDQTSLGDRHRPTGWSSILEILAESLESISIEENGDAYTLTFFREFPDYERTVGFEYRFIFTREESAILLSSIEVALVDNEDPSEVSFRRIVMRTELSNHTAQGLPRSVESKMWRYSSRPEQSDNQLNQFLVFEHKYTIQSIGFVDADYDFSIKFDVGTFVSDQITGSRYRVGNPLNALMEEVAK